jgi:DNA polymerase-3 subunit epsilon
MNRTFLVFDCETTSLLSFKLDLMHESQPRIIQLAAILCNEDSQIIDQINMIAKPDGWTIDGGRTGIIIKLYYTVYFGLCCLYIYRGLHEA